MTRVKKVSGDKKSLKNKTFNLSIYKGGISEIGEIIFKPEKNLRNKKHKTRVLREIIVSLFMGLAEGQQIVVQMTLLPIIKG